MRTGSSPEVASTGWTDREFMPKLMRNYMRVGGLMLLAGIGMIALGGILTLVWPGVIANSLLVWTGPQIAIIGALGYGYARSQVAKHHGT